MKVRETGNARVGFTRQIRIGSAFNRLMLLRYPRQGLAPLNLKDSSAEKVEVPIFVKNWQ